MKQEKFMISKIANQARIMSIALITLMLMGGIYGCNAQTSEKENNTAVQSDNIEVYYSHFTKRCATCNAVESETKMALENIYKEKLQKGEISFTALNLDVEEDKKIAIDLKISGQTLLLVKGDERVNLTNDGFMNARNNPEKFSEILKANIDKLL